MSVILSIVVTASVATAKPAPIEAEIAWIAEGKFCEPETVLPLPDDTLLVSNVCGFDQPGKGFLTLLSAEGKVILAHITGNRIYRFDARNDAVVPDAQSRCDLIPRGRGQ